MQEVWLKTNRRAILLGFIVPLLLIALGVWIFLQSIGEQQLLSRVVGGIVVMFGAGTWIVLAAQLRRPRIAFHDGLVKFYLRSGQPIAVPVHIVESFFAGQSDAHMPGFAKQPQSANLIARLARRNTEWAEQTVKPALGKWSDSYVIIRGTWCEPLNAEVIRRINRRLKEVKEKLGDKVTVLKMDVDRNPTYAQLYNIQSIPTLIIFQKGKIVWRKSGVAQAQEILQHVQASLVV